MCTVTVTIQTEDNLPINYNGWHSHRGKYIPLQPSGCPSRGIDSKKSVESGGLRSCTSCIFTFYSILLGLCNATLFFFYEPLKTVEWPPFLIMTEAANLRDWPVPLWRNLAREPDVGQREAFKTMDGLIKQLAQAVPKSEKASRRVSLAQYSTTNK